MSKKHRKTNKRAEETAAETLNEAVSEVEDKIEDAVAETIKSADEAAEELIAAAETVDTASGEAKASAEEAIAELAEQNEHTSANAAREAITDDNIMEKWYKAAQRRVSIRSFSGTPEIPVLRTLRQAAQMVSTEEARIYVGKRPGIFDPLLKKVITGTEAFAAVILRGKNKYMAGFVGEAFLLECEAMGLGTCWLGASYNHSVAKASVKLRQGEKIVCLIAIGKYDEMPETVGARKSLFTLTGMEDETFYALPEWQQCAVRCARMAAPTLT